MGERALRSAGSASPGEPHRNLSGMYIPEQGCNASHVSDSTIFDIQRWAAEQRFDYGNRSAALSIRA